MRTLSYDLADNPILVSEENLSVFNDKVLLTNFSAKKELKVSTEQRSNKRYIKRQSRILSKRFNNNE